MNQTPTYYALNIGVVHVDESHYDYNLRSLSCCQTDMLAMKQLAITLGYDQVETLLNEEATTTNLKEKLIAYSQELIAGDFLLITYSGHGGQMPLLKKHKKRGLDNKIETWCLYDRQLLDKELPELWANFEEGVTIVLFMDSCHSGGAAKEVKRGQEAIQQITKSVDSIAMQNILRKGDDTEQSNKKLYKKLRLAYPPKEQKVAANFLQLAACQADQLALGGPFMSKFTREVLSLFSEQPQSFTNYRDFYEELAKRHKKKEHEGQIPVYADQLFNKETTFFEEQLPFVKIGQQPNKDQLQTIKALTRRRSTAFVEERTVDLILDAVDTPVEKFNQRKDWQRLSSTKSDKQVASNLYYRTYTTKTKDTGKAWDRAYRKHLELARKGSTVFIEPAFYEKVSDAKAYRFLSKNKDPFLQRWPQPKENQFSWFLEKEYSQLKQASKHVLDYLKSHKQEPIIRIAHIDTGIRYDHIAFKGLNINKDKAKSFIPGEEDNPAWDILARDRKGRIINWEAIQRKAEQDFHGTATLALLAGGHISKAHSYAGFEGEIGGIPFAEIIPIRISETVALTGVMFNVKEFAQAVEYAIDCGCDVISMSMAGSPSRAWARVVNQAYEAGCVIVSAGGNSWRANDATFNWDRPVRSVGRAIGNFAQSLLPQKLMYPARFARVIAATGVSANQQPYNFAANNAYQKTAGGEFMQGNYGPQWAMDYAIAGYTPNIPWAEQDADNQSVFLKSGGGTSSATPQVAAAAALYMAKYRSYFIKEYGEKPNWRWAEATRQALFQSADDSNDKERKYLGRGALKAMDALKIKPPTIGKLKKNEKEAKIFTGFTAFLRMAFNKSASTETSPLLKEMMELEILQILHRDPALMQYAVLVEDETQQLTPSTLESIFEKAIASRFASDTLKKYASFQKKTNEKICSTSWH